LSGFELQYGRFLKVDGANRGLDDIFAQDRSAVTPQERCCALGADKLGKPRTYLRVLNQVGILKNGNLAQEDGAEVVNGLNLFPQDAEDRSRKGMSAGDSPYIGPLAINAGM